MDIFASYNENFPELVAAKPRRAPAGNPLQPLKPLNKLSTSSNSHEQGSGVRRYPSSKKRRHQTDNQEHVPVKKSVCKRKLSSVVVVPAPQEKQHMVFGDSRAKKLLNAQCLPGKGFRFCSEKVKQWVDLGGFAKFVVFLMGLCDITSQFKGHKYREVIQEHFETNGIVKEMKQIAQFLKQNGMRAMFCTIPPIDIAKANKWHKDQGKSFQARFECQYSGMQAQHEVYIRQINHEIIQLNHEGSVCTPMLHRSLLPAKGDKFRYHKLLDGIHPSEKLVASWEESIHRAIKRSKETFPSPDDSPGPSVRLNEDKTIVKSKANEVDSWYKSISQSVSFLDEHVSGPVPERHTQTVVRVVPCDLPKQGIKLKLSS